MPGDYPMEPEARTEGTVTSGTTHGQWETIAPPCPNCKGNGCMTCLLLATNERTLNPFQLADLLRGKAERAAGTRAWSESAEKLLRFAAQQVDALGMERDAAMRRAAEAEADRDLWRERAEAGRQALEKALEMLTLDCSLTPKMVSWDYPKRYAETVRALARNARVAPALLVTGEPEEATPDAQ